MLNLFRLKKKDNNEKFRKMIINRLKVLNYDDISVYKMFKGLYPYDDTITDELINQVQKDYDTLVILKGIQESEKSNPRISFVANTNYSSIPDIGELVYCYQTNCLYIGDGISNIKNLINVNCPPNFIARG